MKKTLKILTTLIGCTLLLAGCKENANSNNNQQNPSGNNQPSDNTEKTIKYKNVFDVPVANDITNIKDVKVEDIDIIDDEFERKTCEKITSGSMGGCLIELSTGAFIEPNVTYNCSYSHTKTFSGEYTVRSDDRTVAQVYHLAGSDAFTIKGISQGDAIIQVYTDEDELVLQMLVQVRNRIPLAKMAKHLYDTDTFYGMIYGTYKLSFLDTDPLKGNLVGSDDFESTNANFTLDDGVEEKIQNGTDFNFYKYKIKVDAETSSTSRN